MKNIYFTILLVLVIFLNFSSYAFIYDIPKKNNHLIGKIYEVIVPHNSKLSLEFFAAKYKTGISNLIEVNPGVDLFLPKMGTSLIIPNKLLIPNTPHIGIIINSVEMRLYFYPKDKNIVVVLPIGIGEIQSKTPTNWLTKIIRKKENPFWIPTKKMHKEYNLKNINLPKIFPPGKDNPMGMYAMYIGELYAIHGTNVNFGIGLRVSHGCIRLRNDDIKWLFDQVPVGTKVQFINQEVKASIEADGSIYLESHKPLSNLYNNNNFTIKLTPYVINILKNKSVDKKKVNTVLRESLGIPIKINN